MRAHRQAGSLSSSAATQKKLSLQNFQLSRLYSRPEMGNCAVNVCAIKILHFSFFAPCLWPKLLLSTATSNDYVRPFYSAFGGEKKKSEQQKLTQTRRVVPNGVVVTRS